MATAQSSTSRLVETRPADEFSVAEARRIVRDLFEPRAAIYWTDFLLSMAVGAGCFAVVRRAPVGPVWLVVFFIGSCLGYYRAALFTHELTHLKRGRFTAFRVTWNLLCGVPFLMPSFMYYTHVAHHVRRCYGTPDDGEYLPWGASPARNIVWYLAQSFIIPLLAVARFLILTPLSWISPPFRRWLLARGSSLVVDPRFVRPLPSNLERRVWRIQEAACFLMLSAAAGLLIAGLIPRPATFLLQLYLTAVTVISLNAIRTLGAHRYRNVEGEMTFVEQLLDSVNYPRRPWLSGLWAPVGLRFHALHHLFPALPYHNLAEAHRRLMTELPADSPYRLTESPGLWTSLSDLWRGARRAEGAVTTSRA